MHDLQTIIAMNKAPVARNNTDILQAAFNGSFRRCVLQTDNEVVRALQLEKQGKGRVLALDDEATVFAFEIAKGVAA